MTRFSSLSAVTLALLCSSAHAAAEEAAPSAEEIAKELANPNATLGFMTFNFDHIEYQGDLPGADSQSGQRISFQPSMPYPIAEGTNLFVRPLIPIIVDQPTPIVGDQVVSSGGIEFESQGVELGDIGFDMAIGKTLPSKTVLFAGMVGTMPTATEDSLGLDQWLLGPEVYVGQLTDWGAFGVLLTHQWDVAGEDDFDTSITGGQYFFTYNLKDSWQIQMQPTFSYNHEAESGNKLTFPVGIGVAKTTIIGKTPWKFSLQYWHYVESPDQFGPDFQIRFGVTPVVPLPW
jgi:hypothetical protein